MQKEINAKKFDEWAQQYEHDVFLSDQSNRFPFIGYEKVVQSIVDHAPVKEGNSILDLGVGTGAISKLFYEKKCKIFGLDFSEQMISLARTKIPEGHFEVIDLREQNLGPFSNNIFDLIVSGYCFHHFTDEFKVSFIKKLSKNNLKDNGKIIIGDVGFCTPEDLSYVRKKYEKDWDKNEYYLCGSSMVEELQKNNLNAEYIKISSCAGLLIISKKGKVFSL